MMTGIDTNVLLRYLLRDDEKQSELARKTIQLSLESGRPIMINLIVLCELVWVLEDSYELKKAELIAHLEKLLQTDGFVFESMNQIRAALVHFKSTKADLSDCLIGAQNRKLHCEKTLTFDKACRSIEDFELLVSGAYEG